MEFWEAILWEFVQNAPLIIAFTAAVWLWARRSRHQAVGIMLAGGVCGALVIRVTEPLIHGYVEPVAATAVNAVLMGLLMVPFAAYLGSESRWISWRSDVILGAAAGIALGCAQAAATPGAPVLGAAIHCLSFALSFPLVLAGIRYLKGTALRGALIGALVIAVLVTMVIGLVDYSYFLL